MQPTSGVSNAHQNFFDPKCREIFRFTNKGFQHFLQADWKALHQKGTKCQKSQWWMENRPTIQNYDTRYEQQIKYIIHNIIQSRNPKDGQSAGSYVPMSVFYVLKEGLPFYYEQLIDGMHYVIQLFETQQGHSPFILCDIDNGCTIYEKLELQYDLNTTFIDTVMAMMNGDDMFPFRKNQTHYTQTLRLQHMVEQMCNQFYLRNGPWLMHIVIKVKSLDSVGKRNYYGGQGRMKRHKTEVVCNTQEGQQVGHKRQRDESLGARKNSKLF